MRTKDDVILKKHFNLISQAQHCVEVFFEVIGQPYEPHKGSDALVPRAAIGVVLSRLVGDDIAGLALEKDRPRLFIIGTSTKPTCCTMKDTQPCSRLHRT